MWPCLWRPRPPISCEGPQGTTFGARVRHETSDAVRSPVWWAPAHCAEDFFSAKSSGYVAIEVGCREADRSPDTGTPSENESFWRSEPKD